MTRNKIVITIITTAMIATGSILLGNGLAGRRGGVEEQGVGIAEGKVTRIDYSNLPELKRDLDEERRFFHSKVIIGKGNLMMGEYRAAYLWSDELQAVPNAVRMLDMNTKLKGEAIELNPESPKIHTAVFLAATARGELSGKAISNLRRYIQEAKGLILLDECGRDFSTISNSWKRVIKDLDIKPLDKRSPILDGFFKLERLPLSHRQPSDVIKGGFHKGQLRVVLTEQWTCCELEHWRGSDHPMMKFGANLISYALDHSTAINRVAKNPVEITPKLDKDKLILDCSFTRVSGAKSGEFKVQLVNLENRLLVEKIVTVHFDEEKTNKKITIPLSGIDDPYFWRVRYLYKTGKIGIKEVVKLSDWIGTINLSVLGQDTLLANSKASIRLAAINTSTGEPIARAHTKVDIISDGNPLFSFEGKTDEHGTMNVEFDLPEDSPENLKLEVFTKSFYGTAKLIKDIKVKRLYRIMLSTDKPLYQPGQFIHIRALVLTKPSLKPAQDCKVVIEVEDPKGNKVFKRKAKLDKFGVVSSKFQLADEINLGPYTIRAIVDEKDKQEKKVTVKRYVLPKFKVDVSTNKRYYLPSEKVRGNLSANYFFGKPVEGAEVNIIFKALIVGEEKIGQIKGKTDEEGRCEFEYNLPDYFVGHPIKKGDALVQIVVEVTDKAKHTEKVSSEFTVTPSLLRITFVPESGTLVRGLENVLYCLVTYPDGSPAKKAKLTLSANDINLGTTETDEIGVAKYSLTPDGEYLKLTASVTDSKGVVAHRTENLQIGVAKDQILLRLDKAIAKVGQTIKFTAFSTKNKGTLYLDVLKERQTILTISEEIEDGVASGSFDLGAEMFGTLVFNAYQINRDGTMTSDAKVLYVEPADDLKVAISADKKTYKPGKKARLNFNVTDKEGHPIVASLMVAIVDESVFALSELRPGLAKVYFMLEREIMKPKYEIHGIDFTSIITEPPVPLGKEDLRQQAANVLIASIEAEANYSLSSQSLPEKAKLYKQKTEELFRGFLDSLMEKISKYIDEIPESELKGKSFQGLVDLMMEEGFLSPGDILDPWGSKVKFGDIYRAEVVSAGPDEKMGTDDDLRVDLSEIAPDLIRVVRCFDFDVIFMEPLAEASVMALPEGRMEVGIKREKMLVSEIKPSEQSPERLKEVYLRQFFPETLLFEPNLITDKDGKATLNFRVADSITTWRVTSLASSLKGLLGSSHAGVRVFQDFFIDLDLPVALTQGDEVSIPVAIYNYLKEPQTIKLKIDLEEGFELMDEEEKFLSMEPNEVGVRYFRIKANKIGRHSITVWAYGSKMSDAIRRKLDIKPDGEEKLVAVSGRLTKEATHTIHIPEESIADASKIWVKIYPGVFSQVVEGLDGILRMPFGCFEQTSSITYPNVLVLDYLKQTKQITPEVQMKAEQYINLGYQRLLTFEVKGGGFSWFGNPPANKVLTAYGVMEFADMSRVYEIDSNVITRTQKWLIDQQQSDGSWKPDQSYLHAESWGKIQNSNLLVTAYIAGALLESGYNGQGIENAVSYITKNRNDAKDSYTLSLVLYALALGDAPGETISDISSKLADLAKIEGDKAWWEPKISTATFTRGKGAIIETTALAAMAFLRAGKELDLVSKAMNFLIASKDPHGTWGSTQGTILAFKALLLSLGKATEKMDANIVVRLGDERQEVRITPEDFDVVRYIDLKHATKIGDNTITIAIKGEGSVLYQVVGRYYLPWKRVKPKKEILDISVRYDKTRLKRDDIVLCKVLVSNQSDALLKMVMVDIGIPPGFILDPAGLAFAVEKQTIQRFDQKGRQVSVYIEELKAAEQIELRYELKAKYPIRALTPESVAWLYYDPEVKSTSKPQQIVVE